MWLIYGLGSAFFAGVTSILAKCGIRKTDSNVATAVRTIVVLLFSWLMVFLTGSESEIFSIDKGTMCFFNSFRRSHRSLLAVLLSGPSAGACQRGGAGRQAEHFGDHSLFLSGFWRTAVRAVGGRTSAADGRNGADGCCIDGG